MKLNSILKAVVLPAIAAFLFVGCTGPAGPEGPQGNPGNDGVANISSQSYTVSTWNVVNTNNFSSSWTAPAITDQANDLVEVYFVNNSGVYLPLPANSVVTGGDILSCGFNNNAINFYYYDPSGSPSGTWVFNVVVVPPAAQKKHPNTNWSNYTEVKAIMDLQPAVGTHKI
jgi:hypothetical protein